VGGRRVTTRAMVGDGRMDGRAQNFEHGFFDQQLESLMEVLKMKHIWGLNVGENFGVSIPAVRPLPLFPPHSRHLPPSVDSLSNPPSPPPPPISRPHRR